MRKLIIAYILFFGLVLILLISAVGWVKSEVKVIDTESTNERVTCEELAIKSTQTPKNILLDVFTVTAYCPCSACCGKWSNPKNPTTASGASAIEGITVGADWATIAPGTVIEIEGIGVRTVQDKPAAWIVRKYDGKVLDLYFNSHEAAVRFGKQKLKVWVYKGAAT